MIKNQFEILWGYCTSYKKIVFPKRILAKLIQINWGLLYNFTKSTLCSDITLYFSCYLWQYNVAQVRLY